MVVRTDQRHAAWRCCRATSRRAGRSVSSCGCASGFAATPSCSARLRRSIRSCDRTRVVSRRSGTRGHPLEHRTSLAACSIGEPDGALVPGRRRLPLALVGPASRGSPCASVGQRCRAQIARGPPRSGTTRRIPFVLCPVRLPRTLARLRRPRHHARHDGHHERAHRGTAGGGADDLVSLDNLARTWTAH